MWDRKKAVDTRKLRDDLRSECSRVNLGMNANTNPSESGQFRQIVCVLHPKNALG